MRNLALSLLVCAGLALSGCGGTDPAAEQEPGPKPLPDAITGQVMLGPSSLDAMGEIAVAPDARLELKLVNISKPTPVTVTSKTVAPVGAMPVSFSLPFDRERIVRADIYVVQAVIEDGERLFTTPLEYPVLTQGAPANVKIQVVPEPTPAEEMLVAFRKLKESIGGMTISQGTSMGESLSRAWQIFRKDGAIHYVIENVDYFDEQRKTTDYTSTDYAYRSGKPWVVVQEHKANRDAEPGSIDRAGWNEQGELVLRQHVTGGKVTELSAEEAQSLREQAEAMWDRAKG